MHESFENEKELEDFIVARWKDNKGMSTNKKLQLIRQLTLTSRSAITELLTERGYLDEVEIKISFDAKKAKIIELYHQNCSPSEIGRRLNANKGDVGLYIASQGLPKKPQRVTKAQNTTEFCIKRRERMAYQPLADKLISEGLPIKEIARQCKVEYRVIESYLYKTRKERRQC